MQPTLEIPAIGDISAGAAIANTNGVPGTLGCLGLARDDGRLVFLTSHHVLFGAGAREQDTVWIAADGDHRSFHRAARVRHGRCGTVCHEGIDVHVDCATAEINRQYAPQQSRVTAGQQESSLAPGDRVTKTGAATGTTEGIVVATDYSDSARVDGLRRITPGQILVRPAVPGGVFSADGDSGAVLRNEDDVVVGLLWGVDARGFGLACPIAPVLKVLHLSLPQFELRGML